MATSTIDNCGRNSETTSSEIENTEKIFKDDGTGFRKNAIDFSQRLAKRGVVYLSRVPPFMKPNKVRSIFEEFGEVTRLFLAEEDTSRREKRIKAGGNGSKQFVEGWIEFADKSVAQGVALSLNNTPIGGKKRSFYHDDIWNLKYLKNFKWEYLTEKVAYERRVREHKLKTSMMQSKRQNEEFIELLDKQKVENLIKDRKRKRQVEGTRIEVSTGMSSTDIESRITSNQSSHKSQKRKRTFIQLKSLGRVHGENHAKPKLAVLRNIFRSS